MDDYTRARLAAEESLRQAALEEARRAQEQADRAVREQDAQRAREAAREVELQRRYAQEAATREQGYRDNWR